MLAKRDRSRSKDFDNLASVNKLIRSVNKKMLSIKELEIKLNEKSIHELNDEQKEKISRKESLQSELKRLKLIATRLEGEERVKNLAKIQRDKIILSKDLNFKIPVGGGDRETLEGVKSETSPKTVEGVKSETGLKTPEGVEPVTGLRTLDGVQEGLPKVERSKGGQGVKGEVEMGEIDLKTATNETQTSEKNTTYKKSKFVSLDNFEKKSTTPSTKSDSMNASKSKSISNEPIKLLSFNDWLSITESEKNEKNEKIDIDKSNKNGGQISSPTPLKSTPVPLNVWGVMPVTRENIKSNNESDSKIQISSLKADISNGKPSTPPISTINDQSHGKISISSTGIYGQTVLSPPVQLDTSKKDINIKDNAKKDVTSSPSLSTSATSSLNKTLMKDIKKDISSSPSLSSSTDSVNSMSVSPAPRSKDKSAPNKTSSLKDTHKKNILSSTLSSSTNSINTVSVSPSTSNKDTNKSPATSGKDMSSNPALSASTPNKTHLKDMKKDISSPSTLSSINSINTTNKSPATSGKDMLPYPALSTSVNDEKISSINKASSLNTINKSPSTSSKDISSYPSLSSTNSLNTMNKAHSTSGKDISSYPSLSSLNDENTNSISKINSIQSINKSSPSTSGKDIAKENEERQPSVGFSFSDLLITSKNKKNKNNGILSLPSVDPVAVSLLKSETVDLKPSCPWISTPKTNSESKDTDFHGSIMQFDTKEKVKTIKEIYLEEEKARLESNLKSLKGMCVYFSIYVCI